MRFDSGVASGVGFVVGFITPTNIEGGDERIFSVQIIAAIVTGLTGGPCAPPLAAPCSLLLAPWRAAMGRSRDMMSLSFAVLAFRCPCEPLSAAAHAGAAHCPGAMLAFVAATMLPAAFERGGRDGVLSGMLCAMGFVAALTVETLTAKEQIVGAEP